MAIKLANYAVVTPMHLPAPESLRVIQLPVDCFDKAISFNHFRDTLSISMSLTCIGEIFSIDNDISWVILARAVNPQDIIMYTYKHMAKQLIMMASESNFV